MVLDPITRGAVEQIIDNIITNVPHMAEMAKRENLKQLHISNVRDFVMGMTLGSRYNGC